MVPNRLCTLLSIPVETTTGGPEKELLLRDGDGIEMGEAISIFKLLFSFDTHIYTNPESHDYNQVDNIYLESSYSKSEWIC